MSSHLAGEDGPIINSVDVDSDGHLIYHTSMNGTADPDDNSTNPTSWTLSQPKGAQQGRSIVITKDSSGNLHLKDTLNGEATLNLVNDQAEAGSDVPETYKTTLHNENYTVEYEVSAETYKRTSSDGTVTEIPRYTIEVLDSFPSTSTKIYQVYIDGTSSTDKFWVEDDMKYSGLFRTEMSDSLQNKLEGATNISYEWHRITIPSTQTVPTEITDETDQSKYEIVRRKQSGEHWNIALDADKATWLDIEADEGSDVWRQGTTHAYYVKLTYTPKGSEASTSIYSTPLTVNYYGTLENGGFENPKVSEHNTKNTSTGFNGGQTSNSWYKSAGGVWQTTGPGLTRAQNYAGRDIEIVDATGHDTLNKSYHW